MLKKNSILMLEMISTLFIMIMGVLLHFTFEWSHNNVIVGLFSPINESVWEHLKLLFFPMLISTMIVYVYKGKKVENYLCAKVVGILSALFFLVFFFYTYTGIIGKNLAFVDISSFFIAVIIGQYVSYQKMQEQCFCINLVAPIILLMISLSFFLFTFFPPQIGLFQDPITKTFGIEKVKPEISN